MRWTLRMWPGRRGRATATTETTTETMMEATAETTTMQLGTASVATETAMMYMRNTHDRRGGGGRWRGASASRPRVARAVEAARLAHEALPSNMAATMEGGLGSAVALPGIATFATPRAVGLGWLDAFPRREGGEGGAAPVEAAAPSHPLMANGMGLRSQGMPATLLSATVRAARVAAAAGRSAEDVWEEALHAWIERNDPDEQPSTRPLPAAFHTHRQRVWGEIEETLKGLRAS